MPGSCRFAGSHAPLPVPWLSAGMSDRQDLKGPGCFLTIDQDLGKVFEQKSAGVEVRLRPAVRGLQNLSQSTFNCGRKAQGRVRTAPQVPVKSRVVIGGGFLMELDNLIGHEGALPDCAFSPRPKA